MGRPIDNFDCLGYTIYFGDEIFNIVFLLILIFATFLTKFATFYTNCCNFVVALFMTYLLRFNTS